MKKPPVIHPFLFAIFPALSVFFHNVNKILLVEIVAPILISLGFAIVLLLLSNWLVRNTQRAGIIASGFLIAFFSFGHFLLILASSKIGSFVIGKDGFILLTIWTALLAFYCYSFSKTRMPLHNVTKTLNNVAIFVVVFLLINIGIYKLRSRSNLQEIKRAQSADLRPANLRRPETLPDIYYIILDRYADAETLKEIYHFDNREFLDYLSAKGFYVATESKSNYLNTAHSLASSLNMEYIHYLSDEVGEESDDWSPLYRMLQDHKVWQFLKANGYKFLHFGSYWGPTGTNQYADQTFTFDLLPQFFYTLYETTMFYPIGLKLGIFDFRLVQWKRELHHFDKLAEVPNIKEPTFAFAHMLIPHDPYVFDRNGEFLTREEVSKRSREENYVNQVMFANKKLRQLIERLLSSSSVSPIIILQSDEGPLPRRFELDQLNFDWRQATGEEFREKMGILNAYYLPNADKNVFYKSVTPVNSFRLIFNLYFNTKLQLLSDESYAWVDARHPYKFFNVTGIVRRD